MYGSKSGTGREDEEMKMVEEGKPDGQVRSPLCKLTAETIWVKADVSRAGVKTQKMLMRVEDTYY